MFFVGYKSGSSVAWAVPEKDRFRWMQHPGYRLTQERAGDISEIVPLESLAIVNEPTKADGPIALELKAAESKHRRRR